MLRKLLKYDFKASYLYLLVCYGIYIVLTIGFSLNLKSMIYSEYQAELYSSSEQVPEMIRTFATFSLMLLWIFGIIGLVVLMYVLIIHRFYSNLAGDQGYLSLTLPVSAKSHMLSKLISGLVFELLTMLVLCGGVFLMITIIGKGRFWTEFGYLVRRLFSEITEFFGISFYLNTITGWIRGLLMIYFSICVGQLFQKHKIWGSIGTYLGLLIVLELFVTIARLVIGVYGTVEAVFSAGGGWFDLVYNIIQIGVYFFLGSWILEKRANLE